MRLVKYVISVSKRHENNHAGVKNGAWMIYYYDEDGKIQTKRKKYKKQQAAASVVSNILKKSD